MVIWGFIHSWVFCFLIISEGIKDDSEKSSFKVFANMIGNLVFAFMFIVGFAIHKAFDSYDSLRMIDTYKKGYEVSKSLSDFIEFYLWSDGYFRGVIYAFTILAVIFIVPCLLDVVGIRFKRKST